MNPQLIGYAILFTIIIGGYLWWYLARDRRSRAVLNENVEAGLTEPASLHPKIDPTVCIGCGSCVAACPEQDSHNVLGMIAGKAVLVEPTSCIGHGACKAVCPVNAITLVFGTERRGVDIPRVSKYFESNVSGIFIAGELGGMGLIRNAIEQGKQAMSEIAKRASPKISGMTDVIIVGAGPAGIAASLRAQELGLSYTTLEQDSLGGSVFQFPRGKLVMTAPVDLPLVGKIRFRETSKEALLQKWTQIVDETQLNIRFRESVKNIQLLEKGFLIATNCGEHQTAAVLLAIGRRGTPRKLGVSGEDLPKVVYRLIDPAQYAGQKVLVVGGGDSAIEAALSIAAEDSTEVTLSYRSEAFGRAKAKNREKVMHAKSNGELRVMFNSNVNTIEPMKVSIEQEGSIESIDNDAVIISAGGVLPTGFLKSIGIEVETKHGTA